MRELALFAGAGGGLLAGRLLGWRTVCAVEIDPLCRSILLCRQRDGMLEHFPIWDDVRTFNGEPWKGSVDVVSGGFPCQDISAAGRGAGLAGRNSGLWGEMRRIIGDVQPAFVFAENAPTLRSRGLSQILEDFADLGFAACWGVLGAWHFGATHKRNRMWIVAAHPDRTTLREQPERLSARSPQAICRQREKKLRTDTWRSEPSISRMDARVAGWMDRFAAVGNGQVPLVAAVAWETLATALSGLRKGIRQ